MLYFPLSWDKKCIYRSSMTKIYLIWVENWLLCYQTSHCFSCLHIGLFILQFLHKHVNFLEKNGLAHSHTRKRLLKHIWFLVIECTELLKKPAPTFIRHLTYLFPDCANEAKRNESLISCRSEILCRRKCCMKCK